MKKENIVRYSLEELEKKPSKTDWARVNAMSEEAVERNALEDSDAPPITEEQWKTAVLVVPEEERKERIAIWIDRDILEHYGKGSKGYQKRLNAALRRMMVIDLLYGQTVSA